LRSPRGRFTFVESDFDASRADGPAAEGKKHRTMLPRAGSRRWIAGAGLAACLLGCPSPPQEAPGPVANVLLISIDTLRSDYLGAYGATFGASPRIDALAGRSVVFRHAVSSNPITLPAHTTLLTGLFPTRHEVHDNTTYRLSESHVTLAELLRPHGFRTGAILGAQVLDERFGLAQGFDEYDDDFGGTTREEFHFVERSAKEVTERAVAFLRREADERFFLFVHYYDPHQEWNAPAEFARRFPDNGYAAEIAYTDAQLGVLLDSLEALGLADSTLVVVTADHGESLGAFGELSHAFFVYQVTQSVPLIVHVPGMRRRRDVDRVAGLVDVVPTVLAQLSLERPAYLQGRDLAPLWSDDPPPPDGRVLLAESLTPTKLDCNPLVAAIGDRWKYIDTRRPELYDLAADPHEQHDRIAEDPEIAGRLRAAIEELVSERSDPTAGRYDIDAETLAALEGLGYLGTRVDDRLAIDESRDDPKDCIELFNDWSGVVGAARKEDWQKAREFARKVIAKRPGMADVYRYLGIIASGEEKWAEAASHYRLYLALVEAQAQAGTPAIGVGTPRQIANANNGLGVAFAEQGRYEEALAAFEEAVRVEPDSAMAHFNIGYTLLQMGREREAIAPLRRALEIDPDHARARRELDRLSSSP
jgi:arylsulfatase A-like enzyme/Flp pilus assembly protein TadD